MKTAIIITGAMRTFDRCLPALHWHVFRHYPDADFFVSTVMDADADSAELLYKKYPEAKVEIEAVPAQPDCVADLMAKGVLFPAKWTPGQTYTHEPYAISVEPQAVVRQLWQLERGYKLLGAKGGAYQCVIRCRPDLWFHSFTPPPVGAMESNVPWWGKFGGCNDRFAVMGHAAAAQYFTAYSAIPDLVAAGCPIHPESLVKAAASRAGCYTRPTLCAEFSTLRKNGETRPPEISTIDLAHLALS
jgi:hypothetical protein